MIIEEIDLLIEDMIETEEVDHVNDMTKEEMTEEVDQETEMIEDVMIEDPGVVKEVEDLEVVKGVEDLIHVIVMTIVMTIKVIMVVIIIVIETKALNQNCMVFILAR